VGWQVLPDLDMIRCPAVTVLATKRGAGQALLRGSCVSLDGFAMGAGPDDLALGFVALDGRVQRVRDQIVARTYTVEDRRKVIQLSVDGVGRVKHVDVDPRWQRVLQAQALDREMAALYRAARDEAAAAEQEAYADAGFSEADGSEVAAALRGLVTTVPGARDILAKLSSESLRVERERGAVAAEFNGDGQLLALEIRTRYAIETDPARLAGNIQAALREGEEAIVQRRTDLAAELTSGRSIEEVAEENLDRLRQRMGALRARLP
jgi:DNA-binding protein YbaB